MGRRRGGGEVGGEWGEGEEGERWVVNGEKEGRGRGGW